MNHLGMAIIGKSMLFRPKEMTSFVQNHLDQKLEADGKGDVGYDQNRADLKDWVDRNVQNKEASKYFSGTTVHWYNTHEIFLPKSCRYMIKANKHLIQTEACVDSEIPHWKDDLVLE
jgi:glucosylceramidase